MRLLTSFVASAWVWAIAQAQSAPDAALDGTELFKPEPDENLQASMELTALFDGGLDSSSPQNLFARQRRTCPAGYPVMCNSIRCCPGGTNCCSGSGCCPTSSNCRSDMPGKCCPKTAQTCGGKWCADAGSVCCTAHVCPRGYRCNELGGGMQCCRPSELSCPGACCPSGSKCGSAYGYCAREVPTRTTRRTTSTRTTTRSSTRTTSPTITACPVDIDRRQSLPTFTVAYVEREITIPESNGRTPCLDNRELMDSMCKGMEKVQGCVTNKMRLTYKRGKKRANKNRRKMCPRSKKKKYCAYMDIDCDPTDPTKPCNPYSNYMQNPVNSYKHDEFHMTCDEFPFANSVQGGDPNKGTRICIPSWQNSFQGRELQDLWRQVGDGNDYIVEVTGWDCKTGKPKSGQVKNCRSSSGGGGGGNTKRDMMSGRPLSSGDLWRDTTSDGKNALMMFLGDIPAGSYNYTLDIAEGDFSEILVIDEMGETLLSMENGLKASSNSQVVSFTADEESYGVALWAFTKDDEVSVSYNMTIPQELADDEDVEEAAEEDDSSARSIGYSGGLLGFVLTMAAWFLL